LLKELEGRGSKHGYVGEKKENKTDGQEGNSADERGSRLAREDCTKHGNTGGEKKKKSDVKGNGLRIGRSDTFGKKPSECKRQQQKKGI